MTAFMITFWGVASPGVEGPHSDVVKYVTDLLTWRKLLHGRCGEVLISARLSESLLLDGLYPLRPHLQQLLAAGHSPEYDANTIAQLAESFLRNTETLQSRFGVGECLVEEVEIDPELRDGRFPTCSTDLEHSVVVMAKLAQDATNKRSVGVADSRLRAVAEAHIRAVVHVLESDDPSLRIERQAQLDASIPACCNAEELIQRSDPVMIWLNATRDEQIVVAINVAIEQSRAAGSRSAISRPFRLGRDFTLTTALARTPTNARKLLRAIVETCDKTSLANTHHLRTGRGPNEPQVTRGDDGAWRRDVDDELHLHYWECADGCVELANIVVHNAFDITR